MPKKRYTPRRAPTVRGSKGAKETVRRGYETRVLKESADRKKRNTRKAALKRAKRI